MDKIFKQQIIRICPLSSNNSFFLFGARGTGKSYLIRETLVNDIDYINLLSSRVYLELLHDPSVIDNYITNKIVVIDEIQRVPEL
ncbi:MAG: AAA family ATPase, partial [Spirochaetales bacterium]|nr:AAA family ATPase [Spirochaetales bacterium]